MGLVPNRGCWEHRTLDVDSAATFRAGSAVHFNSNRSVREYASTDSGFLGIALGNSVDSLPAGKAVIAIPQPGATMTVDVPTGTTAAMVPLGQRVGLQKSGNTFSSLQTVLASVFSAIGTVYGPINSQNSTIEVAINALNPVWFSASTNTFAV